MAQLKAQSKKNSRKWRLYVALPLLAVAAMAALEITGVTHLFHKAVPANKVITSAGSLPTKAPAKSQGMADKKVVTDNSDQGGATDTRGQAASTDSSQWVIAKSGDITVKAPAVNTTVKDGATVSGSAKVSTVQYRLIDNQTGVLAQGPLNVVNGNFSATLHFQAHSNNGRLDVFSYDASDAEINEVQLAVQL